MEMSFFAKDDRYLQRWGIPKICKMSAVSLGGLLGISMAMHVFLQEHLRWFLGSSRYAFKYDHSINAYLNGAIGAAQEANLQKPRPLTKLR